MKNLGALWVGQMASEGVLFAGGGIWLLACLIFGVVAVLVFVSCSTRN